MARMMKLEPPAKSRGKYLLLMGGGDDVKMVMMGTNR